MEELTGGRHEKKVTRKVIIRRTYLLSMLLERTHQDCPFYMQPRLIEQKCLEPTCVIRGTFVRHSAQRRARISFRCQIEKMITHPFTQMSHVRQLC